VEYDPKNVAQYQDQINRGKTIAVMAEELGVIPSTLATALRRHREGKKKPGPKPRIKVKVVDMAQPAKREKSIPELLAGIDFNVSAIKKILGV
jgi:transposase-like protein